MIYIFEGSDLSGKTTLAEAFSKKNNIPLIKKRFDVLGMSKEFLLTNLIEELQKFFWLTIWPIRELINVAVDRSLLSSLVYGTFFEREYDKTYIMEALKDPFVKVFFVYADSNSIERRKLVRTEKLFSLDEILKIQTMYFEVVKVLENEGIKIISINNSDNSNIEIPSI